MFKMLSFGLDAGFESFSSLVNGLVHNCLFQVSPDCTTVICCCCHGNRAGVTQPIL